jgi:hypothetical protein
MAHSLITTFAYGLTAGNTASSPLQLAQDRGWVDVQGNLAKGSRSLKRCPVKRA